MGAVRTTALRSYQVQTLRGLLRGIARERGETFTVMFPRQAGKNEVAAVLVTSLLRNNAAHGGTVVICAPTLHPQGMISFDRTRRLLAAMDHLAEPSRRLSVDGATIRLGSASAVFLSASPAAHVAGHTASLALIGDEAQDIDADWFNRQFRPMAASTGAPTVLFGTPWNGHTLLETTVAANRARDAAAEPWLGGTPRYHLEVDWRTVAASRPRYGDYVRAERRRLGANHPLFLTQYELIAAEGAGGLLSPVQLARIEGEHARLRAPLAGERYAAGLDFGGQGEGADRTVLTIARVRGDRCEVVQHVAWQSAAFATVVTGVLELMRQWRTERLCTDATGMGAPLTAQLAASLGARVEPFVFSEPSKSQLGYDLIAAIDTGRLALYRDDGSAEATACSAELRDCRSRLRGHSQLRWEAPAGGHDDYVASLALCLHAAGTAPGPKVATGRRR